MERKFHSRFLFFSLVSLPLAFLAVLRLHGDELVVSLQVETGEAYRQLADDQDAIVRALRGHGSGGNGVGLAVVFIAMGQASSSDFAYSLGLLRNGQFIDTDREQRTNIPGVFAAGDCVGRFLQISVAVGEGALAGRAAISHVKERRRASLDK